MKLKSIVKWPGHEELHFMDYRNKFSRCVVIMHCFEVLWKDPPHFFPELRHGRILQIFNRYFSTSRYHYPLFQRHGEVVHPMLI